MRRTLVSFALLAVLLAGCSGGSPATATRQSVAQQDAREYAEEAASRRRIMEEEGKQARDERELHQGQVAEAAERLAEENSPASHHYPPAVRAGFLRGCDNSTGHEDAACKCALKRIEAHVTLGRYRENEHEVKAGRPLPLAYSIQYGYCVGREAIEASG